MLQASGQHHGSSWGVRKGEEKSWRLRQHLLNENPKRDEMTSLMLLVLMVHGPNKGLPHQLEWLYSLQ